MAGKGINQSISYLQPHESLQCMGAVSSAGGSCQGSVSVHRRRWGCGAGTELCPSTGVAQQQSEVVQGGLPGAGNKIAGKMVTGLPMHSCLCPSAIPVLSSSISLQHDPDMGSCPGPHTDPSAAQIPAPQRGSDVKKKKKKKKTF